MLRMEGIPLSVLRFFTDADVKDAKVAINFISMMVRGRENSERRTLPVSRSVSVIPIRKASSIRSRAFTVLKNRGTFMTGPELTDAINERFGTQYTKASVIGMIAAYVRRNETFCREELGKYGLIERKTRAAPPSDQQDDAAHDEGA